MIDLAGLRHSGGRHQPARRPRPRGSLLIRFNHYVIRSDDPGACWGWSGAFFRSGYGAIAGEPPGKSMLLAHRVSYSISKGPIPADMCVLHTCDNRACTNPDHLCPGTRTDNHADMVAKRRHPHGDRHHWSRLTRERADLIRAIRSICGVTMQELAEMFGISRPLVSLVLANKIWVTA